ncbi:MAG: 23S rRNA (guanosine(2251)-2'-O)-methyltransferase RlmB [Treponema sp.]|nr:23S rRNA (guanosine(2251)-2'-O)-methyltransferase RlmB [Treponema sp.]
MVVTGFHSIEEKVLALSDTKGVKLLYSKPGPRVKKILEKAGQAGILCEQTDDQKLNEAVRSLPEALRDHRGIVMLLPDEKKEGANLVNLDEWIKVNASDKASDADKGSDSKTATVVILDRVTDPHNVGAIIRSCDQFGADLVILPEHNSASSIAENEIIGRTSAGASSWVPVAIVNNLVRAVEQLKNAGFWIYGADAGGETCGKIDFAEKSVIIMGSEGTGIARLLKKQCDTIVSIPTCGKIDSLNVSVAAGVLLYELFRRR